MSHTFGSKPFNTDFNLPSYLDLAASSHCPSKPPHTDSHPHICLDSINHPTLFPSLIPGPHSPPSYLDLVVPQAAEAALPVAVAAAPATLDSHKYGVHQVLIFTHTLGRFHQFH